MKLPSILDLAAAASLHESTLRALAAQRAVSGSTHRDVEVMLVPCLQTDLLAAMRSANVSVEQPSPAFDSAFADLGLDLEPRTQAAAMPCRSRADRRLEPQRAAAAMPPADAMPPLEAGDRHR